MSYHHACSDIIYSLSLSDIVMLGMVGTLLLGLTVTAMLYMEYRVLKVKYRIERLANDEI